MITATLTRPRHRYQVGDSYTFPHGEDGVVVATRPDGAVKVYRYDGKPAQWQEEQR